MKELKINIPEGYEIDEINSTFECIKFKKKQNGNGNFIDLGLPSGIKWCDRNIGASNPENEGEYFNFEKANESYNCPTLENIKELIKYCKIVWVKYRNVNGHLVIGKNGNYIFFPASGQRYTSDGSLTRVGSSGYYWTATPYSTNLGRYLGFSSSGTHWGSYGRAYCFPVREITRC